MRIFYTTHADLRLRERGITKAEVEAVIISPDLLRMSFSGKLVASKLIGKKNIEIVFIKGRNKIIVVTLYSK